jgi:hypothetical protein
LIRVYVYQYINAQPLVIQPKSYAIHASHALQTPASLSRRLGLSLPAYAKHSVYNPFAKSALESEVAKVSTDTSKLSTAELPALPSDASETALNTSTSALALDSLLSRRCRDRDSLGPSPALSHSEDRYSSLR